MTRTEEILARKERYTRVERVTDELDRVIGVRQLKPSQQVRVQELASGLQGTTPVVDEDPASDTYGRMINVPRILPLMLAASVAEIDASPVTFPKSRAELDAVLDMLDDEGIKAVLIARARLDGLEEGAEQTDGAEVAKNSRSTPRSDKPAG